MELDSTGETASTIGQVTACRSISGRFTAPESNECEASKADGDRPTTGGTIDGPVVTVEWRITRAGTVALVSAVVTNPSTVPRTVRIENRLDGPALPPRRAGIPAAGWDDTRFEAVVDAGETLAVGYACPAESTEPPIEIRDEPAPVDESESDEPVTTAAAIRRLDEHAPPRAALPTSIPAPEETTDGTAELTPMSEQSTAPGGTVAESGASDEGTDQNSDPEASGENSGGASEDDDTATNSGHRETGQSGTEPRTRSPVGRCDSNTVGSHNDGALRRNATTEPTGRPSRPLPPAVRVWVDDVERRLDAAERLDAADTETATETVRAVGGAAGAAELETLVEVDVVALRVLARQVERLLERGEQVDVPVDALERLT